MSPRGHRGPRRSVGTVLRDPLRTLAFLLPALVTAVLVPLLARAGLRTVTNSRQGRVEQVIGGGVTTRTVTALPPTPAAMLLVQDASGAPASLALMAVAPSGRGGTLVVLPLGLVGASGARLDASFTAGGLAELASQVEQTLQITLAASQAAAPDTLGPLLAPLTPVSLTFDDVVRGQADDGSGVVRQPGPATLDGAGAAVVLAAKGADESELARLERTRTLWAALLAARHDGGALTPPAVGPSGPAVTTVAQALGALAAAASPAVVVAAEPRAATGPAEELVADLGTLRTLTARILPGAVSPLDGHARLRLVNPAGDPAVSLAATRALVAAGANVVMVDDAKGTVPARTSAQVSNPSSVDEVTGYRVALGALDVQSGGTPVDGLDATVVIGADAKPVIPGTVSVTSTTAVTTA